MKERDSDVFHYLITHTGFRDWVQNPSEDSNYFWKRWMEENPESIAGVKKAREFIERMNFRKEKLPVSELDDLLGKILADEASASLSAVKKSESNLSPFLNQWFWVAAILLISVMSAVVISTVFKEVQEKSVESTVEWITLENPKGRKSKVTLPDGTKVNINYESQLKFPKIFEGSVRRVELIGEAFFEVAHDDSMPFIVQTYAIETEVLGTSFNVKSFAADLETEISLVNGEVKINGTNKGLIGVVGYLAPGERLSYNRKSGAMVVNNFDLESVTAWKEGVILFKDAGFEEFVNRLEKWYGVNFQIYGTPSKKWRINGRYQNEKLDNILRGLRFVYGLDYKILGGSVILKLE